MPRKILKGDNRDYPEIKAHYEIEVELANKLKNSTKEERKALRLYTSLYDELFQNVPNHQQLVRKASLAETTRSIAWQLGLLKNFISNKTVFLEIGPGDCLLSFKISELVEKAVAVDVSTVITNNSNMPDNFELFLSDGSSIPIPDTEIDIVYSNMLIEHIHPEDVIDQLYEIYRVLKAGGRYICITPNSINGPWDISYYYDDEAKGFHLKEYMTSELITLFKKVGFRDFKTYVGARGRYIRFPLTIILLLEKLMMLLPTNVRITAGRNFIVKIILGIKLVSVK